MHISHPTVSLTWVHPIYISLYISLADPYSIAVHIGRSGGIGGDHKGRVPRGSKVSGYEVNIGGLGGVDNTLRGQRLGWRDSHLTGIQVWIIDNYKQKETENEINDKSRT